MVHSLYAVGEFVNHGHGRIERNGVGIHVFANGMEYSGAWSKDKMCGNGNKLTNLTPQL